jgi:hypothetical protein
LYRNNRQTVRPDRPGGARSELRRTGGGCSIGTRGIWATPWSVRSTFLLWAHQNLGSGRSYRKTEETRGDSYHPKPIKPIKAHPSSIQGRGAALSNSPNTGLHQTKPYLTHPTPTTATSCLPCLTRVATHRPDRDYPSSTRHPVLNCSSFLPIPPPPPLGHRQPSTNST